MFERFGKLFGPGVWAKTPIVLLTAGLFGVVHYLVQGLAGAEQATIFGLVFGMIFAVTGGIFILMVAHGAFDLAALAITTGISNPPWLTSSSNSPRSLLRS